MPVRTDFSEFRPARDRPTDTPKDWLFVGRVVPNKNQALLVEAFERYHRSGGDGHLHLVGDCSDFPYVNHVRFTVDRLGLQRHVSLHGKLDQAALINRYLHAGVYISLSEHEGFGVPLLEAMAAGVPVVALRSSAIAETMGGAGILIDDPSPSVVTAATQLILHDDALRAAICERQLARIDKLGNRQLDELLDCLEHPERATNAPLSVQIQGPFDTSYSLAMMNRELALALDDRADGWSVTLRSEEGHGPFEPDAAAASSFPSAMNMYERGKGVTSPDVVIRQMHPLRLDDSPGALTFQYFGWEESRIPQAYVNEFNSYATGIGVFSNFVRDVLIESGVTAPIAVVGCGVQAPSTAELKDLPELRNCRSTRLLHISSAFPRKGVDVLLQAYFDACDARDDVTLVLKTFPNPHNDVAEQLHDLQQRYPNGPHVCWIDRDLERSEIDSLYASASAYIHPARGEGFGLPVAEAMLAGVPVVATAATGLADFVSQETAAVIRHHDAVAATHLSVPGSRWAEPDRDDVAREIRNIVDSPNDPTRAERVRAARALVEKTFGWPAVAQRWIDFVESFRQSDRPITVASVTTYNSRCGIAEYAAQLHTAMLPGVVPVFHADKETQIVDPAAELLVSRTWENYRRHPLDELIARLGAEHADITHIQYNMGYFSVGELGRLLDAQSRRRPTIVTLHRTLPLSAPGADESLADIASTLSRCSAVIVHQPADRDRLASYGVTGNVHVLPIGTSAPLDLDPQDMRRRFGVPSSAFVVGAYGFLLPHKNLLSTLGAVSELRTLGVNAFLVAACAIHPDQRSTQYLEHVKHEIFRLKLDGDVLLDTRYLPHEVSMQMLSTSDVIVLPYEETPESSSAAIRSVLPLGRAVLASDLEIFADVRDHIATVPTPVQVADLTDQLIQFSVDLPRRAELAEAARTYAIENSWDVVAARTAEIYKQVIGAAPDPRSAELVWSTATR